MDEIIPKIDSLILGAKDRREGEDAAWALLGSIYGALHARFGSGIGEFLARKTVFCVQAVEGKDVQDDFGGSNVDDAFRTRH